MTRNKTMRPAAVRSAAGMPHPPGKRRLTIGIAAGAAFGCGALVPFEAIAYEPTTFLGQIGQTELQRRTGDAVQTTCGQLGQLGDLRSNLQDDLFDRCGNMVGNAAELTGNQHPAQPKSLGWATEEELGAIVQTVANEELAATRSMATELSMGQASVAYSRLRAVRAGTLFSAYDNGIGVGQALAETDSWVPLSEQRGGGAGDSLVGAWGVFANVNYSTGDRDGTDSENEFDYDSYGITVGADYRLTNHTILGGLLSYEDLDADFDDNSSFSTAPSGTPGGNIDADSWGIGLYGTHYVEQFYIDGLIGYTRTDYDIDRRILLPLGPAPGAGGAAVATDRTARASTDADSLTLSVGGGMDLSSGALSYGPFARLTYQETEVDGYNESGAQGLNLTVEDQDWDSLTLALGGQISRASSQDWGVLTPYARLAWLHEFEDDAETLRAFYTVDPQQNELIAITDDPDEDYFELNLGLSAVMRDGVQAFFDYQTLLSHRYIDDHSFTVGVRLKL